MDFDQIKEDLELFTEWEDRYGYIIDLGKQISLPDEKKTDENKVNGCASQVWLDMGWHEPNNTLVQTKEIDPRVEFEKLGLNSHLSSQRSNGLKSMIDQIKIFVNT